MSFHIWMQLGNLSHGLTQWGSALHGARSAWIPLLLSHPSVWRVSSLSWHEELQRAHQISCNFAVERGQEVRGLTSAINTHRTSWPELQNVIALCFYTAPGCFALCLTASAGHNAERGVKYRKGITHLDFLTTETCCGSLHVWEMSMSNQQHLKANWVAVLVQLFSQLWITH